MTHPSTDDPTAGAPAPRRAAPPRQNVPVTVPPATMTGIVARHYGDADQFAIEEVPTPVPGSDQVLVRVRASSANALDWHFLSGTPYFLRLIGGLRRPRRIIHGADVAGVVVAIGSDVKELAPGDRVFGESNGGGFAPYATVKPKNLVRIPDEVSFETAGAVPVAGLTALQALRTHAGVEAGDHVLINGAAGGVGTFAVQIAKALGAEVTAVCSTRNVGMVRRLGADRVIDYTTHDFVAGDARFDVMLDNVGNRTPAECISVLRPDGRYVVTTGPKKNRWVGPMVSIARSALAFRRASQSFSNFTASPNHEDLTFLGELLANGSVTPEVQRTVGLDGVPDALREIATGHTRAKIVVKPEEERY